MGIANPTANVTVDSNTAYRNGEFFHHTLTAANSSAAAYPTVTVISTYGAGQTDFGEVFVPKTPDVYTHDADGNLSQDGRWTYTWDGENRLVEMKRDSSSLTGARQKLAFEYDHEGRRIRKQFYTHNGSSWTEQSDLVFLYDGWNLIGELDNNASCPFGKPAKAKKKSVMANPRAAGGSRDRHRRG